MKKNDVNQIEEKESDTDMIPASTKTFVESDIVMIVPAKNPLKLENNKNKKVNTEDALLNELKKTEGISVKVLLTDNIKPHVIHNSENFDCDRDSPIPPLEEFGLGSYIYNKKNEILIIYCKYKDNVIISAFMYGFKGFLKSFNTLVQGDMFNPKDKMINSINFIFDNSNMDIDTKSFEEVITVANILTSTYFYTDICPSNTFALYPPKSKFYTIGESDECDSIPGLKTKKKKPSKDKSKKKKNKKNRR